MKQNLLPYCAWILLAVASAAICPLFAQDNPPPSGQAGSHLDFLTPQQKEQLKTDRKAVFAANPSLKEQGRALWQEHQALRDNGNATPADKKALWQKMAAYRETMDQALLQQDPSVKPILDEIAQRRKQARQQNTGNDASSSTSADIAPES